MDTLQKKIKDAIEKNEVSMHSRMYIYGRTLLWTSATILMFGTVLFFVSALIFVFRANGLHLLPFFGSRGWMALFFSLPWLLLGVVAIVSVLLFTLSRHYAFVYKRPLVHTLLAGIVVLACGGVLIAYTTLHERAYERAHNQHGLPIAGPLYRGAIGDRPDVHVGIVSELTPDSFVLNRRDGQKTTIIIEGTTLMHPELQLAEDMLVVVMGDAVEDTVHALGVRPAEKKGVLFPKDMRQKNVPSPPLP